MYNNLKEIWNKQETPLQPDVKKVIEKAREFKNKSLKRLLFVNISLVATAIFMGLAWYYSPFTTLTAKLGTLFAILSIIPFLIASNQIIPLIKNISPELDLREYMHKLLNFRKKEAMINKLMVHAYYLLLALGISLYLVKSVTGLPLAKAFLLYALPLGWIAYGWLYKRPKRIATQQAELNEMISRLEKVYMLID